MTVDEEPINVCKACNIFIIPTEDVIFNKYSNVDLTISRYMIPVVNGLVNISCFVSFLHSSHQNQSDLFHFAC